MTSHLLLLILSVLTFMLCHSQQSYGMVRVNPETMRLIDQYGRELYFHGVNVVYKVPPYVPRTDTFDPIHSFVEEDMKILSELGLNVIRLGVMWPGAEPTRGKYNETYYNTLRYIIDTAYAHGIYTILDMHQDVLSEKFCGEGAPDWAVNTGDAKHFPYPFSFSSPGNRPSPQVCAEHTWSDYYITESVGRAFQNIYNNTDGLLDSLAQFWKKTASEFNDIISVIGYELINEPWIGDLFKHPSLIDPVIADVENLSPVYQKLSSAIREVDQEHVIMFESVTLADFGTGFKGVPGGEEYQNRSVLSYHFYSPPDLPFVDAQFRIKMLDLQKLKCGGFLTEFFICQTDTKLLGRIMDACDLYKQSWTGWMYKLYGNITGDCSALFDPDTGDFNQKRADLLSRTYPQAVAGEVQNISFNSQDSEFNLVYITRLRVVDTVTQIYLNAKTRYADNPIVVVTADIKYNVTRNDNIVLVVHEAADNQVIKVNITPP